MLSLPFSTVCKKGFQSRTGPVPGTAAIRQSATSPATKPKRNLFLIGKGRVSKRLAHVHGLKHVLRAERFTATPPAMKRKVSNLTPLLFWNARHRHRRAAAP